MEMHRKPRTPREKYGAELRIRRTAVGLTQDAPAELVVCSRTLISHFEAGRRLPNRDDAARIDRALDTDGFFGRWLKDLESKYAEHFASVAELERRAVRIRQFALSLIPGILQTPGYARALFTAYRPNHRPEEVDREVVTRTERASVLDGPLCPVVWTLLDEAVLRRQVGGPLVMAEQLHKIADLAEAGRVRLHVLPFGVGAHALDDSPIAYVDGLNTGHLMDDPALVAACHTSYDLALSDALSHQQSLALIRAAAEDHEHGQQ